MLRGIEFGRCLNSSTLVVLFCLVRIRDTFFGAALIVSGFLLPHPASRGPPFLPPSSHEGLRLRALHLLLQIEVEFAVVAQRYLEVVEEIQLFASWTTPLDRGHGQAGVKVVGLLVGLLDFKMCLMSLRSMVTVTPTNGGSVRSQSVAFDGTGCARARSG